jgi:superfamily II DNA or RNA helicase
VQRPADERKARLVLGSAKAHEGYGRHRISVSLPTLTLRFLYDGHEVGLHDQAEPRFVEGSELVILTRDLIWEEACYERLQHAGAIPVEDLEFHSPTDQLMECDFAFADGEFNLMTLTDCHKGDALTFAFHTVPVLRAEGWDIDITAKWPFRLTQAETQLLVETRPQPGDRFEGHGWFDLGFQVEINGKRHDMAPLIAAFLEQLGADYAKDQLPDPDALRDILAARPIFIDQGKGSYTPVDLRPIAAALHLFLRYHIEAGRLHPADATLASETEAALEGSGVRFADHAGILPLARSLQALRETSEILPPRGLHANLRSYQSFGAAWMGSLITAGFGGVLADDMGLGKTLQVLTLLQARREQDPQTGSSLLVVPTSLLHVWQTQAAQFTPQLRVLILHGTGRKALLDQIAAADLVVTTYPLLARDQEILKQTSWALVIADEAQTLKNPAAQMAKALRDIPAKGRLALTGTPMENSLQDLWTLFDWVVPGLLGDRKTFHTVFRTPIEKQGDAAAQARLNRRLRPFLLRRTKEEVATELPPRTEIIERVEFTKPQQALYETVRSVMDIRVRDAIAARGIGAARITILDALLKLRQVCCDPVLVKTEAARDVRESAKRSRLKELLQELVSEGRRVLVFSQFVEMLTLISADLTALGIAHLSLTGQTQNRSAVLQEFAEGDAPVFLLSLKAGGVGLTLTQADTVILYDPWWNPAVERQAMDRAHRIGQDKPVFVHRLVAARTVEEKILLLQERKQALADALFTDGEDGSQAPFLDEAALTDLFAPLES